MDGRRTGVGETPEAVVPGIFSPLLLPSGTPLDFSGPPIVMGIVNCNEDSFFPPSRALAGAAVEKALSLADQGAGIIDLGAESTRPGAAYISAGEELERLVPVIERIRRSSGIPLSVDTRKAEVARACLDAGADIINDISALEDDPGMGRVCGEKNAAVVLMHKRGVPENMQDNPRYGDAPAEVGAYLREAADRAVRQGIGRERIILDPGIGFGKRLADNLAIIAWLAKMCGKGYPVLVGLSRKTFVGELTGRASGERLAGTLAAEAWCVLQGARILRVHDVRETVDMVKVLWGIMKAGEGHNT
ncbi:MAG: dihydropteroate synthase [Treponema sp.]|jgi:dihydropteroate synthase|nr:dihydropteroate synthase [Treponema sp.]